MTDQKPTTLDVWMDGDCPLCQKSQAWCERRDTERSLRFSDFRAARDHELPVARDHHETAMWARDADGNLYRGFEAWLKIMAEIPGWRWFGRLASLPPFTLIGPAVYRWISSKRHALRPR